MIFRSTKADGARPSQAANPMEARFVFAGPMGNIDGIWTAVCHGEMKLETSSNGLVW
jgi:hypothetical protein